MTVRTSDGGSPIVHAGSREELAVVAEGYAADPRRLPHGLNAGHLLLVAERLRAGVRVCDLGPLRFYADRADGTPFRGPFAPDPDPGWLEQQQVSAGR